MKIEQTTQNERFSPVVEEVLRQAGWYPGRVVDETQLQQWYVLPTNSIHFCHIFPAALRVLTEFGGLQIVQDGPGITCARSSFVIDPIRTLDLVEDGLFVDEWFLEKSLYPLGIFNSQEYLILIDSQGKIWIDSIDIGVLAENFDQAMSNMILGISSVESINMCNDYERLNQAVKIKHAIEKFHREKAPKALPRRNE